MNEPAPDAFADRENRVAAVWKIADTLTPQELVRTIDALAGDRPADDPFALFERACARDTAGLEDAAEPLYRAALASAALDPYRPARPRQHPAGLHAAPPGPARRERAIAAGPAR
jgi:hypothetical protein